jgi:3'-5' exoribonuclease
VKEQFVAELMPGDTVDTVACVRGRDLRLSRTGEPYLWLELADRTGMVQAVRFGPAALETAIPEGSVARVRGQVGTWRGEPSVRVSSLEPAATYDRLDLLASTTADPDGLKDRLRADVAAVRDRGLRGLVHTVFAAPGFARRFAQCPGSADLDHAWLGGLLEHTVTVCALVRGFSAAYPQADGDLLLAAAVLHDIGRVDCLEFETGIGVTLEGRLAGHRLLGLRRLDRAVEDMEHGPSERRVAALRHAVWTHHSRPGEEPATLEALLLSQADRTDREAAACVTAVGRAIRAERAWTSQDNPLGRVLLARASHARGSGGGEEAQTGPGEAGIGAVTVDGGARLRKAG